MIFFPFLFRLSRLISLLVLILILGTNYYYFFIEAEMYGLSRDGMSSCIYMFNPYSYNYYI